MERKGGSTTVAVTAEEVKAALGKTRSLATEEEKALRMRHGVSADPRAPLPKAAGQNEELADELLLMEMQLLRAFRARQGLTATAKLTAANPQGAKAKERIIRGLRKKR